MFGVPLSALLSALGVAAGLELIYLLVLRKHYVGLVDRLRYHFFVVAVATVLVLVLAQDLVSPAAFGAVLFVAVLVTVNLVYRLLDRFWLARQHDRRGRLAIPKLARDLVGWLLILGTIVVAGHSLLGIEYREFTLSVTVLSAVVGFALQDVLKNVFAGLALQTEATFETGDWIVVDGEPRQVLEMSWRTTHLRNTLGVDFRVPNGNLSGVEIVDLGSGMIPMGFEVEVGVVYGAPPQRVKESLERAAVSCSEVVPSPPPQAFLSSFGDSGIVYRLRYWTRQVHGLTRVHSAVRTRVWYQLKRDGFTIPFPIRTVEYTSQAEIAAAKRHEEVARVRELVDHVDFLAALPEEGRQRLAESAHHLHFDAGERLVIEGEKGDSLYLIARGSVMVSKSGTEVGTSNVELATLGPGAFFGETSLLTGAPRSATVTAEEGVEVFVLDREALAPILHGDPTIAETLSRVLAERIAATVARFEDRLDQLRRTPAHEQRSLLGKIRDFFGLGA